MLWECKEAAVKVNSKECFSNFFRRLTMTATREHLSNNTERVLYLSLELGMRHWELFFTTGPGQQPRHRQVKGRDRQAVLTEIAKAKHRFGLDPSTPLRSCYEAGRDGFWLHHWLTQEGVDNLVVDAGSMLVNGRRKKAKTDRLDGNRLLRDLLRWHSGQHDVWSVVRVPSAQAEEQRQLHRELETLKEERTAHVNRLKGLLMTEGIALGKVTQGFPQWLAEQRRWDGAPLAADLQARLLREWHRWQQVQQQIGELTTVRQQRLREGGAGAAAATEPAAESAVLAKVRRLLGLRGVGMNSAWLLVMEFFGWRVFGNRREVASLAGLTPTPYDSGDSERDQGISKAGNRWVRALAIELAWSWLRYQPDSALARWFNERFGRGSSRQRKIGIVAVARKLLVGLWRYLEDGEVPAGAVEVDWRSKLKGGRAAA
jgi:transposase